MADFVEAAILGALASGASNTISSTYEFSKSLNQPHDLVVGVVRSLSADGYTIMSDAIKTSYFSLTEEGESIRLSGSQEQRCWNAINDNKDGIDLKSLEAIVGADVAKVGVGNCMKNKWVAKNGALLVSSVSEIVDSTQQQLTTIFSAGENNFNAIDDKDSNNLKKRKLIKQVDRNSFSLTRGPSYKSTRVKKAADLTKEMLDNGSWKETEFKDYNFATVGEKVGGGFLHPLLKVRAEFRKILLEMGFSEMPTNKWVESSFWNFDALFQPQSHPARDAHDTFFIKEPGTTLEVPNDYYERVKDMHENGGSGSIGYRYVFKEGDAMKNLLRTHTTAVSSQMLYKLANQEGGFKPMRYFSIDRVFRNESMDATHLCEFHQVEGLVADYNLSLGDLIGTIQTFFKKIGITQLRFKPAFNPYTEPSMEIFGYHPDLKKWTEIGNSGMFRPEMLSPMGLPAGVRVIAWGLSLERPTMIKYRIKNIRDLFGHKVELARTKSAPVCRFD